MLGLLLVAINRISALVMPASTKFLIDDVVVKRDSHVLVIIVLSVLGATVVQAATSFLLTQLLSKAAWELITDLRIRVQSHIGRLPVAYFDANRTGALVSRIMSDVEGIRNLVGTGLVEFLAAFYRHAGLYHVVADQFHAYFALLRNFGPLYASVTEFFKRCGLCSTSVQSSMLTLQGV